MERSATTTRSTGDGSQVADASQNLHLVPDPGSECGIDLNVDPGVDLCTVSGAGADAAGEQESVVVHVQLRPRRPAVRKCLAALAALSTGHPSVGIELTGLSKDDRVVRLTVGIDLGPTAEVAKFSASAQAAYLFVDGLFTSMYDYMPVYVAEPSRAERVAALGVLDAPRPFIPTPRRGEPTAPPAGSPAPVDCRALAVPA